MSVLEKLLWQHLKWAKLPLPIVEYKFHPTRQWRADFCWLEEKLIVEVEGGIYTQGRHVRGKGYEADCEKYNHAVILGFKLLRVTSKHIQSGEALNWIENILLKSKEEITNEI